MYKPFRVLRASLHCVAAVCPETMGIAIRTRHMLERCVDGRKAALEFAVVDAPTHPHSRVLQGPI